MRLFEVSSQISQMIKAYQFRLIRSMEVPELLALSFQLYPGSVGALPVGVTGVRMPVPVLAWGRYEEWSLRLSANRSWGPHHHNSRRPQIQARHSLYNDRSRPACFISR